MQKISELVEKRFSRPTKVQSAAFEPIYNGFNVVVCSETGSGKTEAVLLPIFVKLSNAQTPDTARITKIIYITPLRALNRDVEDRIRWLSNELKISVGLHHGDTPPKVRLELRQNPPTMIVTTPESFQALISQTQTLALFSKVEHIIIDEANELVQSKRGIQLTLALARFRSYLDHPIQIVCLSATVKNAKIIRDFFIGENSKILYLDSTRSYDITIDIIEDFDNKDKVKQKILENIQGKTIIFVNTRHLSERLAKLLEEKSASFDVHHSSLSLEKRIEVENKLKSSELRTVIATSSLELGVDIGRLERVIQVGSPRSVETLAQRLGRSGHRTGLKSVGTIIAFNAFDLLESVSCAILLKSRWLEKPSVPKKPLDVLANQIVAHLLLKKVAKKQEILQLFKSTYPYRELTDSELESVLAFLERNRQILLRGDTLLVGPRTKSYFYSNLSTIISLEQYRVKDIASRKNIGMLDGAFVERYCDAGSRLALGKNSWEIT